MPATETPSERTGNRTSRVEPYSFAGPQQLAREHRVALEGVFTRFRLSLQDLLSSLLRTPLDVSLHSLDHMDFAAFRKSLSAPCATFVFDTGCGVGGEGIVDVTAAFGFYIVDRLFGGQGEASLQERSLSELEQAVVRGVAERLLALLRDAWKEEDLELTPEIIRFEANPENLRADGRVQTVIVAQLTIRAAEGFNASLVISLPLVVLGSFLDGQVADRNARVGKSDPACSQFRESIANDLRLAHVFLSARLAPLSLSARCLAALAPGQVIQTSQHIDLPIELHVNGRCRYLGTLGQVRRHVGLQITATVASPPRHSTQRTTRGRIL